MNEVTTTGKHPRTAWIRKLLDQYLDCLFSSFSTVPSRFTHSLANIYQINFVHSANVHIWLIWYEDIRRFFVEDASLRAPEGSQQDVCLEIVWKTIVLKFKNNFFITLIDPTESVNPSRDSVWSSIDDLNKYPPNEPLLSAQILCGCQSDSWSECEWSRRIPFRRIRPEEFTQWISLNRFSESQSFWAAGKMFGKLIPPNDHKHFFWVLIQFAGQTLAAYRSFVILSLFPLLLKPEEHQLHMQSSRTTESSCAPFNAVHWRTKLGAIKKKLNLVRAVLIAVSTSRHTVYRIATLFDARASLVPFWTSSKRVANKY